MVVGLVILSICCGFGGIFSVVWIDSKGSMMVWRSYFGCCDYFGYVFF